MVAEFRGGDGFSKSDNMGRPLHRQIGVDRLLWMVMVQIPFAILIQTQAEENYSMIIANRFWSQIFGVVFSNKHWLHLFMLFVPRLTSK